MMRWIQISVILVRHTKHEIAKEHFIDHNNITLSLSFKMQETSKILLGPIATKRANTLTQGNYALQRSFTQTVPGSVFFFK